MVPRSDIRQNAPLSINTTSERHNSDLHRASREDAAPRDRSFRDRLWLLPRQRDQCALASAAPRCGCRSVRGAPAPRGGGGSLAPSQNRAQRTKQIADAVCVACSAREQTTTKICAGRLRSRSCGHGACALLRPSHRRCKSFVLPVRNGILARLSLLPAGLPCVRDGQPAVRCGRRAAGPHQLPGRAAAHDRGR